MLCLFGVQRVMPNRVVDLLACWIERFTRQCSGNIWSPNPFVHNVDYLKRMLHQTFEGIEQAIMDLKMNG